MRKSGPWLISLIAAVVMVTTVTAADEDAPAEADEIRDVLEAFDVALADVSRDIDQWEAWMVDPDVVVFEHEGVVVPFDLAELDELVPLAANLMRGEPELQRLITDRRPELAFVISGLDLLGADGASMITPQLKDLLRQDEDAKRRISAPRLDELDQERRMVDDLIDALQADLDEAIVARGAGDGSGSTFPPPWLDGKNAFVVQERLGSPPSEEPTFVLRRGASTYAEDCWTQDDGLHYCARRPDGWVGVYQDFELGYRWYDLADRTTCELHVTGTTADSTSGLYEPCPGNGDSEELLTFTIVGVEWDVP